MTYTLSVLQEQPPTLLLDMSEDADRAEYEEQIRAIGSIIDAQGWMTQLVYVLVDVSQVQVTFGSVTQLFLAHNSHKHERGAASDPLMLACFVGKHAMMNLASQLLAKASKLRPMLMFSSREDALKFFSTHYEVYIKTGAIDHLDDHGHLPSEDEPPDSERVSGGSRVELRAVP